VCHFFLRQDSLAFAADNPGATDLQHETYPVSKDLRLLINGGIFSTLNILPIHPTIEQWFDAGSFCVEVGALLERDAHKP
jgi:hypothetical protein